ncbi:hypothetical protein MKMG_01000 [Methanogenium sp. MK-MG]|nr:hypothetical protein MKMG_01000 [Methanogenium sp. MK-MG]
MVAPARETTRYRGKGAQHTLTIPYLSTHVPQTKPIPHLAPLIPVPNTSHILIPFRKTRLLYLFRYIIFIAYTLLHSHCLNRPDGNGWRTHINSQNRSTSPHEDVAVPCGMIFPIKINRKKEDYGPGFTSTAPAPAECPESHSTVPASPGHHR